MIAKIQKYLLIITSVLILFPAFASAQYGCGSYNGTYYGGACSGGVGQISTNPVSTTPPKTADLTIPPSTVAVFANGQALTPNTSFPSKSPIVFSGTTTPYAEVHLYFHSNIFEAITNADANGFWSYNLIQNLGEGEHTLEIAIKNVDDSQLGVKSSPSPFIIGTESSVTSSEASLTNKTTVNNLKDNNFNMWLYIGGGILIASVIGLVVWLIIRKRNKSHPTQFGPTSSF